MSKRESHEVVVALERSAESRSSLAVTIGEVLDVPTEQVMPLLKGPTAAVASYAFRDEAARVAEALSARDVSAHVVSEGQRAALERTVMPGWSALDAAEMAPATAETIVGMRSEEPAVTSRARNAPLFDDGDIDAWDALASELVGQLPDANRPMIDVAAAPHVSVGVKPGATPPRPGNTVTADLPSVDEDDAQELLLDAPPAAGQSPWSSILGEALSARMTGEETLQLEAVEDDAPVDDIPVSTLGATAAPPLLAGDAQATDATLILPGGAPASPWAAAGVDLATAVLVDADDGADMPSPPEHVASEDAAHARPPIASSRVTRGAPAKDEKHEPKDVPVFQRLRPPEPDRPQKRPVTVSEAKVWGVLAPGGGQAYLGRTSEGVTYALGGLLIVPWIQGARAAVAEAHAVVGGEVLAARRPSPGAAARFAFAFWGIVALLVGIVVTAARFEPVTPPPNGAPVAIATADDAESDIAVEADAAEIAPDPQAEAAAEAERERELQELLERARRACQTELYYMCRDLAEEALALDDRNREAQLLHVRAVSLGVVEPTATDSPEPPTNDRPSNRPSPGR